jgi:hypothetical protein
MSIETADALADELAGDADDVGEVGGRTDGCSRTVGRRFSVLRLLAIDYITSLHAYKHACRVACYNRSSSTRLGLQNSRL